MCPSCGSIYTQDEFKSDKTCNFIPFPDGDAKRCGTFMGKESKKNKQNVYIPRSQAAIASISDQLRRIFSRPGFEDEIESWRGRKVPEEILGDFFDGRVWNEAKRLVGKPFLTKFGHLVLQLNYDDLQPYEKRIYGVGAVYLCIMNLPRSERYKRENTILVAIFPPLLDNSSKNTNAFQTYLRVSKVNRMFSPIVDELLVLWQDGLVVRTPRRPNGVVTRHAVLCM